MDEDLRETANIPESGETAPNEETEPETKSIHFAPSAYDPRGIEQWLSERAAEGKFLLRYDDFVTGEPQDCLYHLEPAADDDDPDEGLREKRARLGWEYVCRTKDGIFYIWRGDRTAHVSTPKACTDSYGYRTVCKKLRRSYFLPLVYLLMDAGLIFLVFYAWSIPLLSLLTIPKNDVIQGASIILGSIIGMFSGAQERKAMRTLKRAMEDCEYVEKMPRNRWAGAERALSLVVVVLMVAVLFGKGYSNRGDAYDEPTLPYLRAEELGGDPFDWCYQRDLSTPLGGHVYSVGETPYAGMIDNWWLYSTELDFYAPRISTLAKPLTCELRDYFMGSDAQTLSADGFDEAYYAEFTRSNTRLPNEPDEVRQFLILRRGGEMLYFRTEAPDDLRDRLDEFTDIFGQYSELS